MTERWREDMAKRWTVKSARTDETAPPFRYRIERLAARGIDLVEDAAVGEVGLLSLAPAAKRVVDGDELDLGEAGDVGGVGVLGLERPVVVLGGEALALGRVEILEVGLGD